MHLVWEKDPIAATDQNLSTARHFLSLLEMRIGKPFAIIDRQKVRGFRFGKPGALHYIVLNISRSISLVNAMVQLSNMGFKGESAILARALLENSSKLQYVVGGISIDGIDKKSAKFLSDFFADIERDTKNRSRYVPINQKDINRRNSERFSRDIEINKAFGLPVSVANDHNELEGIQSSLYNEFSNHVHGRYPEMMDIYGEKTLELKLFGNLESQDIDGKYELAYFEILSEGILKGFRTALLCLGAAKMIHLSDEEMKFSVGNILAT